MCTKVNDIPENNDDYTGMLNHKQALESESDTNVFLHNVITYDEVKSVVKMAGNCDQIYNDILDNMDCKLTLMTLFNACFAHSKIPEYWLKSIISPIPKRSLKDQFIPVSYRGVSLLSHVGKLYPQI